MDRQPAPLNLLIVLIQEELEIYLLIWEEADKAKSLRQIETLRQECDMK